MISTSLKLELKIAIDSCLITPRYRMVVVCSTHKDIEDMIDSIVKSFIDSSIIFRLTQSLIKLDNEAEIRFVNDSQDHCITGLTANEIVFMNRYPLKHPQWVYTSRIR